MTIFARTLGLALSVVFSAVASAAPPVTINVHGQLLGPTGTPVSGNRAFQITFFDAETGGATLGNVITGTVEVSDSGLFNMGVTPPAAILSAGAVWYAVGVDTDSPADGDASDDVFPNRIRVYSVPFALQAQEVVAVDATRVGDGMVDNTELTALNGVTGNIQQQLDAMDGSAVTQNTNDIATNTTNITANATALDMKADASDVAQNTTDVAANVVAIGLKADETSVTANTMTLGTNTTNIAANTSALALKANSADVYTQSAADTAFVDAGGDTMSGALGVDTINEATTDVGVTADGVMLKDSYVGLSQIMAPGDTSNKLYNVGGSLFFGGTALGGGSVDKDGINNSGALGFDWLDSEVDDALSIAGGTVDNDSFSAFSDLTAESKIGTGATQVAAGNHGHTLSALSGSVTDGQVPDALTIQGGTVDNDSFSALSDLGAESAIGTGGMQVAAGNHGHTLSALSGAVTDAQVPDNITITEADTLDTVAGRGATTDVNLVMNGANQTITYTQAAGNFAINSDSSNGLGVEGVTILNGDITNVGQVRMGDGTAGAPGNTFASDTNTGVFRPGADQLAFATGGTARMTIDDAEVNLTGNTLEIATSSAPGTTTNKLYNTSGNLFWNGTQLNAAGGGDKDSLNWSSTSLGSGGNGLVLFAQKMLAAGTVIGVQTWCNVQSNNLEVDLRKNGTTMLTGTISFVTDTIVDGTLSTTSFNANDVLSLQFSGATGDAFGPTVNIIVEY